MNEHRRTVEVVGGNNKLATNTRHFSSHSYYHALFRAPTPATYSNNILGFPSLPTSPHHLYHYGTENIPNSLSKLLTHFSHAEEQKIIANIVELSTLFANIPVSMDISLVFLNVQTIQTTESCFVFHRISPSLEHLIVFPSYKKSFICSGE